MSRASVVVWLAALVACGLAACGEDSKLESELATLSGDCLVNSDCASPLVCVFERCHVECITTRDCEGELRCIGAQEPDRVCQLESETPCATSIDCAEGLICGADGECRDQCQSDAECIGEQLCTKGVCAEPSELDEAGNLPELGGPATCRLNSDCSEGLRCAAHQCLPECESDRDCSAGERCDDGACRDAAPSECRQDDDCATSGQSCVGGHCLCACQKDVDCAAGQTCNGCACQGGPPPECQALDDCSAGEQCVDGACLCQCVEDRDCEDGQSCDGCACLTPLAPTTIHDAVLLDARDFEAMAGITSVEAKLVLLGLTITTTQGLESLESVGSLTLMNVYNLAPTEALSNPLVGLANLTSIEGDLRISSAGLTALELHPDLTIGGNVMLESTQMTCADIDTFQQQMVANGFSGSFEAPNNGDCYGGQCMGGSCFPVP
jgi:hypothetical protein